MAKAEPKYLISRRTLLENLNKNAAPNNLLISVREKVLQDEIINLLRKNLKTAEKPVYFNAEERIVESLINECASMGLFAEKKIIVLRNVKKFLKNEKISLLKYLSNPNPDTHLVMISNDEEFIPGKIFLYDSKENPEIAVANKKIVESSVRIFQIEEFSPGEIRDWIREQFGSCKISDDVITHFMQFTNNSLDEILSEIEKLKTFCADSKEVTMESVNLCNGMTKDFSEMDFIRAIIERNRESAFRIYNQISLKKDAEIFLIFLLNSAFVIISKFFDPATSKLNDWETKRNLKLWGDDQQSLLPVYRNYSHASSPDKISAAFSHIYNADKTLKSSGADKQSVFTSLINSLCGL